MLVPHTDLAENNHLPMEGTCCFLTLLIHGETPFFSISSVFSTIRSYDYK